YRRTGTMSGPERAGLFEARVSEYRAEVRAVAPGDAASTIDAVCGERSAHRPPPPAGLPAGWRPTAARPVAAAPLDAAPAERVDGAGLDAEALERVDGVVTGCTIAIAETGTIVLTGGETEGERALTLVPDLHICVVREDQIVELVPEAVAVLHPLVTSGRRP